MAFDTSRIKTTNRGFNYVEVTPSECRAWGGMCVCDGCNGYFDQENMYLSFVLADCFCKDCWEDILKRQEKYSEEDVKEDLELQREHSFDWYRYHLDADFRNDLIHGAEIEGD